MRGTPSIEHLFVDLPQKRRRSEGATTLIGSRTIGVPGAQRDAPSRLFVWQYALLGVGTSAACATAAVVYLISTPAGPNRPALYALAATPMLVNVGVAGLFRLVIGTRWEDGFFYSWSAATLLVIAVAAQLDGGLNSPLSWLLILPVVYASINYPPRATAAIAALALACVLGLMILDREWSGARWFQLLFVLTFDIMAVSSTANRRSYEVAEMRLAHDVTHDGLTGCLTNAAFHDRLEAENTRAERAQRPFTVIMADADRFKALNDAQGHLVGDQTLQAFARALLRETRPSDAVGRLGGDEFAILLPETDAGPAARIAARLRRAIHRETVALPATLSFGVATSSWSGETAAAVMRRADRAMYEAKREGGDAIAVG